MNPSIRVESISKQYRIGGPGPSYQTLRESLMSAIAAPVRSLRGGRAASARSIWALRDVSFEIMPGEAVGIIGRNGAGKTTLLKILSRITRPTSGSAELRGRVGSLLDVGTGFHPELTGRENIFLNGAILGMTRAEVRRKLGSIVEFAGVGQFLETPLKHYSSGMRVRLAFSVAAHMDTEILLADEVLAVGDVAFQKKCIEEMGALTRRGRTVLFVSHNMGAVGELCPKSILIEKGELVAFGGTREMIQKYLSEFSPNAAVSAVEPPPTDQGAVIRRVGIADASGKPGAELDWALPFSIAVEFRVSRTLPALSIGVTLVNALGVRVIFSWLVFQQAFEPGLYQARGEFPEKTFASGRYAVEVVAENYSVEDYHMAGNVASFEISPASVPYDYDFGEYALLHARIPSRVERLSEPQP